MRKEEDLKEVLNINRIIIYTAINKKVSMVLIYTNNTVYFIDLNCQGGKTFHLPS